MRRRRLPEQIELADLVGRVRALEARPRPAPTSLVPVMSQDEMQDDRYGIVADSGPHIGTQHFPHDPYDGQVFWLHEMESREMYFFIWCEMDGKWISPTYYQAVQNSTTFTETGVAWGARTNSEIGRITIPNGKALWDIGVNYEVTMSGRLTNGGVAQLSRARVAWYDWQQFDTSLGTPLRFSSAMVETASGSNQMQVLDWEQLPDDPDPSGSHFTFVLQTEVSGATGTYAEMQFTVRLVHEPPMEDE